MTDVERLRKLGAADQRAGLDVDLAWVAAEIVVANLVKDGILTAPVHPTIIARFARRLVPDRAQLPTATADENEAPGPS